MSAYPSHRCARLFAASILCVTLLGAGFALAGEGGGKAATTAQVSTLAEKLNEYRELGKAQTPPEILAIGQRQLEALKKAKIVETALQVGAKAPEFSLSDSRGEVVNSKELLARGPIVVTFYRGGWCPYCNLALNALQASLPAFEAEGATLVAISPESPNLESETVEAEGLEFHVLSDHGLTTAKAFGVTYELTAELDSMARGFGLDIAKRNGSDRPELPLGATYVIDQQGVIRYAFLDVDYSRRAEPADILEALQGIEK